MFVGKRLRACREKNASLRSRVSLLEARNRRLETAVRNARRVAQWDRRNNWKTNPEVILLSVDVDTNGEFEEADLSPDELELVIAVLLAKARERIEAMKPRADTAVREAAQTALSEK